MISTPDLSDLLALAEARRIRDDLIRLGMVDAGPAVRSRT